MEKSKLSINENINKDLKKWERKSSCEMLQYINHNDDIINFKLNDDMFTITYSNISKTFLLSYENDTLSWLGFLNIYTQERRPSLYKLLKRIESEYDKHLTKCKKLYDPS